MTIDLGEQCSNFDLNASACLIDWLLMFGACGGAAEKWSYIHLI